MVRRVLLVIFVVASLGVPFCDSPTAAEGTSDADDAAEAAKQISRLEAAENYDALYDLLHPDAQAFISREVIVGWYRDTYAGSKTGELTVTDVQFVTWTWGVTGTAYPDTAEVSYVQPFFRDGAWREVTDVVRLVKSGAKWR
jgi:hypothetical protein